LEAFSARAESVTKVAFSRLEEDLSLRHRIRKGRYKKIHLLNTEKKEFSKELEICFISLVMDAAA